MTQIDSEPQPGLSNGSRAAALFREAQRLADVHVGDLIETLGLAMLQASEIAEGGEIYASGIRDVCKKLTEHLAYRIQAVNAIQRHDQPFSAIASGIEHEAPALAAVSPAPFAAPLAENPQAAALAVATPAPAVSPESVGAFPSVEGEETIKELQPLSHAAIMNALSKSSLRDVLAVTPAAEPH
jgi:hypothetical protein